MNLHCIPPSLTIIKICDWTPGLKPYSDHKLVLAMVIQIPKGETGVASYFLELLMDFQTNGLTLVHHIKLQTNSKKLTWNF